MQVKPATITFSEIAYNSVRTTIKTPGFTVGRVKGYTVKVKQGTTVITSEVIPTAAGNDTGNLPITYKTAGLKSNTSYTIEVGTDAVSYDGKRTFHAGTSINFITAKSSLVAVAKPVVTLFSIASKTATVTWKKPAVTGSLQTYIVFVTEKGSQSMRLGEYSPVATTAVLPSILKPNTTYTVSIIAIAKSEDGKNTAQAFTNIDFTTPR